MKKLIVLSIMTMLLSSCYEDYIEDFDFSSVYFAYQENTRTLIAGEGMQIKIGATLAGVMENNRNRAVNFEVDETLLDGTGYTLLPAEYYTLSNNQQMVIEKGWHQGSITLTGNFAQITADPDMVAGGNPKYAIPLVITSAEVDSVLETKKTAVIALQYENTLYGNYWHGGQLEVKDASGATIGTSTYEMQVDAPEKEIWKLETLAGNKVLAKGRIPDPAGDPFSVELELSLEGNSVGISSVDGSDLEIVADGGSQFNASKKLEEREISLNYKFQKDGNWWHVKDQLKFRNRVRDGVNEWQGFGATIQ